jgi:hypothetical protein
LTSAGGGLLPPLQPTAKKAALNAIIRTARCKCRRRRGESSRSSPARLHAIRRRPHYDSKLPVHRAELRAAASALS